MIDLPALRRAAGLTQVGLAAKLDVGQAQVSKVERQAVMLISGMALESCDSTQVPRG
jgi:transcriptional regulator with XRE-family HTH domain